MAAVAAMTTVSVSVTAGVQSTLSPYAKFLANQRVKHVMKHNRAEASDFYVPVVLKLSDASAELPDYVNTLHRRGCLVLATVDQTRLNELATFKYLERIEASVASSKDMNEAINFCNVASVIPSDSNPEGLTGKGVVTGFCDDGFDPNHLNFKDSNGVTRIKKYVVYDLASPTPTIYTGDDVTSAPTDDSDATHATHVCGIMSGSYDSPYGHGIAPEADIVATTSSLYTAQLLDGAEQVLDYAKSQGKPAVINMSISTSIGPHDGTTLFNQYIDELTKEATICISAGNEGQRPGAADITFTDDWNGVHVYARQWPSWSTTVANGAIDIWADDYTTFDLAVVGWSINDKEVKYHWDGCDISKCEDMYLCSEEYKDMFPNPSLLPDNVKGYIYITGEYDQDSGRFRGYYYSNVSIVDPEGEVTVFGPEITGQTGAHVEVYSSQSLFLDKFSDPKGFKPTSARVLNDLAMGGDAICVGSMDSRTVWPMADGNYYTSTQLSLGGPSYFSSYGTLRDGTVMPSVCAPGAMIISSLSNPYYTAHPGEISSAVSYQVEADGTTHYWGPMQGTSMASPFAAGVCALWLQSCPDLTGKDIHDIAIETAATPEVSPTSAQWGNGILDATAGLKLSLTKTGNIDQVSATARPSLLVSRAGTTLSVTATTGLASVVIRDLTGRAVLTHSCADTRQPSTAVIDLSSLPSSLYIIEARTPAGAILTHKLLK